MALRRTRLQCFTIKLSSQTLKPSVKIKLLAMSIELQSERGANRQLDQEQNPDENHENQDHRHIIPVLPPTDGGRQAWSYLLACFIVEAVLWGRLLFAPLLEWPTYYEHF